MTEPLSPAAQAILAAVTQQMYDCNPEDLPNEAARIAYTLRLGFRALADAVVPEEPGPTGMRKSVEQFSYQEHRRAMRQETRASILSIATGADALTRAAELLERHAAPVPTFRDAIQLAKGCHDYSGGYGGTPCAEAFHAGIGTVVNVLTQAASGSWDHQTKAVFAVGADLPAERHAAPVPVPVSERPWQRQGWCDKEGRFWAEHISRSGVASWRFAAASDLGGWAFRCLPAHALPLPAPQGGEVQP